jgi:signal transduction histidine kinase
MKPAWHIYRREMKRYSKYLLFGPLIAFVIYLLNLQEWRAEGAALKGLLSALAYGLMIPGMIWLLYAAVFAVTTMIFRGRPFKMPWVFFVSLNAMGMISGIWLARHWQGLIVGQPVSDNRWLPSLFLGALITILFFFHHAYREAREETLRLQASIAEARYQALEKQMRPHFLFNSLNSLAELIEAGEERAIDVVYKLADIYRLILANSQLKTAPLTSELEIVERYLEIEQLRFGQRLTFAISVAEGTSALYAPSLVLQTLVENAVKHGVAKSIDGGHIEVSLTPSADGWHQLSVTNTGAPLGDEVTITGTGIKNTRARLSLLYGERHNFRLEQMAGGRTVASLKFSGRHID